MNTRPYLKLVTLLGASSLLLAGALAQDDSEEQQTAQSPPAGREDCVIVSSIRNFVGLSDRHVYLESGSEHFLLTMDRRCTGLANAENITLGNPSNRVCSNSLAEIAYRGVGGRAETCWIRRVESVEDLATARDIVGIQTAIDEDG